MTTLGEQMAQTDSLHIRVPQELREEIDRIAASLDRSRNYIVTEALEQYLDVQRWQVELIQERLAEAESGNATFIPHEEVMNRQEKRLREKLGV
jgi:predicted transcriptional regulator